MQVRVSDDEPDWRSRDKNDSTGGGARQLTEFVKAQHAKIQRNLVEDLGYTLEAVSRQAAASKQLEEDLQSLQVENKRLAMSLNTSKRVAAANEPDLILVSPDDSDHDQRSWRGSGERRTGQWKLDDVDGTQAASPEPELNLTSVVPSPSVSMHETAPPRGIGVSATQDSKNASTAGYSSEIAIVQSTADPPKVMKHWASKTSLSDTSSESGLSADGDDKTGDKVPELKVQPPPTATCSMGLASIGAASLSSELQAKDFEILPVWRGANRFSHAPALGLIKTGRGEDTAARRHSLRRVSTTLFGNDSDQKNDETILEYHSTSRCAKRSILNPNKVYRAVWDCLSFLLIVYDVVAIPLQTFDLPPNAFLTFMTWLTRVFWTLDIYGSFSTGYERSDGFIEMRHLPIAKRYLRTWFALDFTLVIVDWLELAWSESSSLGVARIGKATRAVRIVRMIRVIRMKQVMRLFTERVRSEHLIILLDIIKIMLIILGSAHIAACIWYGIGVSDARRTWTTDFFVPSEQMGYRYLTSLHWSLAQFSGGMDEVRPTNTTERFYAICVFLLAFMMAAVLTSSLTSSMTRLHMLATRQSQQISSLRRFLTDLQVPRILAHRVQRNAQHALLEQLRFQKEDNVELLALISEPLRMELHFEMYSSTLVRHPFFQQYLRECPHVMRKVCHYSTSMTLVSSKDIIFNAGEVPMRPKMFFVCSGNFEYYPITGKEVLVQKDDWVSEACLWIPWMHRGSLRANVDCRLCELDAKSFQEIVGQFEHSQFDPKSYAAFFAASLNQHEGEVTDLTRTPILGKRASRISAEAVAKVAGSVADRVRRMSGEISQDIMRRMSSSRSTARVDVVDITDPS